MPGFTLVRTAAAPAEVVFDVLTDHRAYPSITPVRAVDLEREGDPAPNGVGAIRALRVAGPALREEVTVYDRPHRFGYRMLSGAPVRDHVADVRLEPTTGGTRIVYHIETTPTMRVGGAAVVGTLRIAVLALLRGVVREAERRGDAPGPA